MSGQARSVLVVDGDDAHALSAVRSLSRSGWRVLVQAHTRTAASRHAHATVDVPCGAHAPARFAAAVHEVSKRDGVDAFLPCDDLSLELWLPHAGAVPALVASSSDSAGRLMDKAAMLAAAEEAGFPVPRTRVPSTRAEARDAVDEVGLPCVLKRRRSFSPSAEGFVLERHLIPRTREQADLAFANRRDDALPLVQEFVRGRAMGVAAVIRDGRFLAKVARETFTYLPVRGGNSVWMRTIGDDQPGVREAFELLRALRFEGLGDVQYIVDESGAPKLMEVGLRLNAWADLAITAGVDIPAIAAAAALGDDMPDAGPWRVGVERRAVIDELKRINEALRHREDLPPGIGRGAVLRGVWPPWRPGMTYKNADLLDLRPSLPRRLRARRATRARRGAAATDGGGFRSDSALGPGRAH